jgi:hypothetical protein
MEVVFLLWQPVNQYEDLRRVSVHEQHNLWPTSEMVLPPPSSSSITTSTTITILPFSMFTQLEQNMPLHLKQNRI